MNTLNSTTPHYVRCIKPNDLKEPFLYVFVWLVRHKIWPFCIITDTIYSLTALLCQIWPAEDSPAIESLWGAGDNSYQCCRLSIQVDVRGVLQQVPPSASRASEPGSGPGSVQTGLAWADPRPRPVLLWKDQSVFPSWSGGSSGETKSWEAVRCRGDHPESGQRMGDTD